MDKFRLDYEPINSISERRLNVMRLRYLKIKALHPYYLQRVSL